MIHGSQQTIRFHVDDVLSSHSDKRVKDNFVSEITSLYGKLKECTLTRGRTHDFLGMVLTFRGNGCLISLSTKQKLNSRSSTESKLIAVDNCIDKALWIKLFLGA